MAMNNRAQPSDFDAWNMPALSADNMLLYLSFMTYPTTLSTGLLSLYDDIASCTLTAVASRLISDPWFAQGLAKLVASPLDESATTGESYLSWLA
ncbi:hypothetical protein MY10362_008181 [Beauveria mimosiformis]